MGLLNFTWYYIIVFLFVLTVLIYVHEWGHYWVARRNGVRVEVFSIGFGPEIIGWTNELGTRWKIGLIPLGGYVKMFGENLTSVTPLQIVGSIFNTDGIYTFDTELITIDSRDNWVYSLSGFHYEITMGN